MIVGIGVDLVDIARFERTIERTPRLIERLFSGSERILKPHSLAARYAAKEALIKALGGSDGVHWTEIEVASEASGRPHFVLTGSTAAVIAERGITAVHLSLSHDAGLATAYVIAESDAASGAAALGAGAPAAAAAPTAAAPTAAAPAAAAPAAPPGEKG